MKKNSWTFLYKKSLEKLSWNHTAVFNSLNSATAARQRLLQINYLLWSTLQTVLSTFRVLPTILQTFPHFWIPHFTFCIPHSAIPHFTNNLSGQATGNLRNAKREIILRTTRRSDHFLALGKMNTTDSVHMADMLILLFWLTNTNPNLIC